MMTEAVDLTLVIRKSDNGLTVSVLPKSNSLKDEAQNHIVPLTVSGQPQELDADFIRAIGQPVQRVAGLITNMKEFEKQADKAAANSKAAKEAKSKETKEEREKREKCEKYLKKADELIAAKKHSEALAALKQARTFAKPQELQSIDEKIEAQKKELSRGSLFDMSAEPETVENAQPAAPQAQQQPVQQDALQPQAVQQVAMPQQQAPAPQIMTKQQNPPVQQQPYPQPVPQPAYPQQPAQGQPMQNQHPIYAQPVVNGQQAYPDSRQQGYAQQPTEFMQPQASEDIRRYAEQGYDPGEYAGYPDFPTSMLNRHTVQQSQII